MVWSGEVFGATSNVGVPHGPALWEAGAPLTALQIESWRLLRDEWAADTAAQTEWRGWDARRTRAQPEAAALAHGFLAGELDAPALRAAFDQHTRAGWDTFGLRGVSGAMFLNRLVKHARGTPFGPALDQALRAALCVPPNAVEAAAQLVAFAAFVRELGPGAQPASATGFVSAWWQLQRPVEWPGYQPSTRETLAAEEGVFLPTGDPTADYVAFRAAALALSDTLALHPWALEHLCWWHQRRDPATAFAAEVDARRDEERDDAATRLDVRGRPQRGRWRHPLGTYPSRVARAPVTDVVAERSPEYVAARTVTAAIPLLSADPDSTAHTHIQWLLARLGRRLGCRVWVAANDHHRAWQGERLGALSVDQLPPLGLDRESQHLIELIDVVWLRGASQVAAAFEVECTTSVHAGLLRMADLAALAPNLAVPLYVVVPEARLPKVRRELRRPALQALELHRRCGFFSTESLVAAAPEIARWASGPEAIGRLAERLELDRDHPG